MSICVFLNGAQSSNELKSVKLTKQDAEKKSLALSGLHGFPKAIQQSLPINFKINDGPCALAS